MALSLEAAVDRAVESNLLLLAERGDARAAAAVPLEASRAFLPTLALESQFVRTTDPVAVFGLKLRQERFAAADLQLDPLNRPDPYTGFRVGAVVEQPIFSPEGLFGYSASRHAADAHAEAARRAAGATTLATMRAYWGAQFARARVQALHAGVQAARAHAQQAEGLREQGMVTGLDARLARIEASRVEADRVTAAADAANALAQLRTFLNLADSVVLLLTDSLDDGRQAVCLDSCPSRRADLAAAELATRAASASVRRAWAGQLPSITAFGSVAHHSQDSPFGGGSGDWTVGVALVWKPFQALAGVGAVRRARAEEDARAARLQAARDQARLEQEQSRRTLGAARERVEVATRAREEAGEALRQAQVRYRTGVAPITELLDVQAALTASTLNLLAARHDALIAQANLDFAYGVFDR